MGLRSKRFIKHCVVLANASMRTDCIVMADPLLVSLGKNNLYRVANIMSELSADLDQLRFLHVRRHDAVCVAPRP